MHKYVVRATWSLWNLTLLLLSVILARSIPMLFFYLPCALSLEGVYKPRLKMVVTRTPPFLLSDELYWNTLAYLSPLVRFLEFLLGALVAKLALHETVRAHFATHRKLAEIGSDVSFAFATIWMLYIFTDQGCQYRFTHSGDLFVACLPLAFWMLMSTHSKPDEGGYEYYGLVNKMLACKPLIAISPWTYAAYMYQANVAVFTKHTGFMYKWQVDAKIAVVVLMWFVGGVMYTILELPAAGWLLKNTPSMETLSLPWLKDSPDMETQLSERVSLLPAVAQAKKPAASYGTITDQALGDVQVQATPGGEAPVGASTNSIQEP
eukprot:4435213-Pyramimonas_sp.AAC.1